MIPIGQIEIFMFRAEKSNLESVCSECIATHDDTNFVLAPQITQRLRRPSKWSYQFQRNSLNTKSV